MDRILPNKIEAVLLYDQYSVLTPSIWHKLINEFSLKNGVSFELTPNVKTPDFFHFLSDRMTIEVDYVSDPVMVGAFENSLASNYTKLLFPDANEAVEKHACYIHIVITNGQVDPPNPFIEEQNAAPEIAFQAEAFDFAAELLRWLSIVQISAGEPLAVYWAQCDKLLPSRDFLKTAIEFKNQSLMVHPVLYSEVNDETGAKENGLYTWGASALIGCEIRMDCVPLPYEELIACIDHLVAITNVTGIMVPENHVFGRAEDEEIRVHYKSENGESFVQLIFERCEAFGITRAMDEDSDELDNFDLEDPAERAMFERIKTIREAAAATVESENDHAAFTKELHEQETWSGVKNKVDMTSLRNLTKAVVEKEPVSDVPTGEPDKEESQQPQQKRILKKFGGLFSRN